MKEHRFTDAAIILFFAFDSEPMEMNHECPPVIFRPVRSHPELQSNLKFANLSFAADYDMLSMLKLSWIAVFNNRINKVPSSRIVESSTGIRGRNS